MGAQACPGKPLLRFLYADRRKPQQVIQAAAVNPDVDNLALVDKRVKRDNPHAPVSPELGTGPSVRAQVQANFDVQVLGQSRASTLRPLAFFEPRSRYSALTEAIWVPGW